MAKDIVLTKEGIAVLQEEYRNLVDVQRPEIIEAIKNAKEMGDLSENADYSTARDKQGQIESRIHEIEEILASAKVFVGSKGSKINISNTITFKNLSNGNDYTVKIVSSVESDPKNGKISNESPLGVALIGHKAGEKVTVMVAKPYEIEIKSVK